MAKVLISFLGTGPQINKAQDKPNRKGYLKATYNIDENIYENKHFIGEAIVEHFDIDKIIIAGTMKSIWEKFYEIFARKEDSYEEEFDLELWNTTHQASHKTPIDTSLIGQISSKLTFPTKPLVIKYGLNSSDFQNNFTTLVNAIEEDNFVSEGDTIYLDITHAFRSIPVYLMMVILYLRDVSSKNVVIKDILYGMYDVKWEMKNKYTPIISLKSTIDTLDWIKGAYTFQNFGNGELIAKLLEKKQQQNLAKKVKKMSDAFGINYASNVKSQLEKLEEMNLQLEVPESLIVPKVIDNFKNQFEDSATEAQFQVELAEWYYDNRLYSSAYILLAESLITFVCEEEGYSDVSDKNKRNTAKGLIFNNPRYSSINRNNWYKTIQDIRNDIAHASIGNRTSMNNDIVQLNNRIQKAKKIIYKK